MKKSQKKQEQAKEENPEIKRIQEHNKKKIDPIISSVLAKMLEADCRPILDSRYIETRVKQVLENKVNGVQFDSEEVREARKKLFDAKLKELRKVKVEPLKIDDTEEQKRYDLCEPVVQYIVTRLLEDELIYSDNEYFTNAFKDDDRIMLNNRIFSYGLALFDGLFHALDISTAWAIEYALGKDKYELKMSEMDRLVKGYAHNLRNKR